MIFDYNKLKEIYNTNQNISEYLKSSNFTTLEINEIMYDIQTGSYIKLLDDPIHKAFKLNYTKELSNIIQSMYSPNSILEAGIGEGTTIGFLLQHLNNKTIDSYGFDISLSRVLYAKNFLKRKGYSTNLCTGNLINIPYLDNSIDIVYTSHSIEPNGGYEQIILEELYRVTRKYLILLEPEYNFANEKGKKRMKKFNYCMNLKKICKFLGYNIIKHEKFKHCSNPLNPTAITIIEKKTKKKDSQHKYMCPKFKSKLLQKGNIYMSKESPEIYPVINSIPCLNIENAILCSKIVDFT